MYNLALFPFIIETLIFAVTLAGDFVQREPAHMNAGEAYLLAEISLR